MKGSVVNALHLSRERWSVGLFLTAIHEIGSVSSLCIRRSLLGLSGSGNSDHFRTQWEIPFRMQTPGKGRPCTLSYISVNHA